jgi:HSP20 family protein
MRHAILTHQRQEDLGNLARHMSDLVQKVLHSGFSPGDRRPEWSPSVDICELDDRYEIIVDLAGVRREDIEVFTEDRQLTVAGTRPDPTPPGKKCLHQMEIEQGRFRRAIVLPEAVDAEGVTARYKDGLLRVHVPKRGPAGEGT